MFGEQGGAEILEDQRRLGVVLERFAVKALGRAIVLLRVEDCAEVVEHVGVPGIQLERRLVAAGCVNQVEHHLVGDAHLVPHVGRGARHLLVSLNGRLVALVRNHRVADVFRSGLELRLNGGRLGNRAGGRGLRRRLERGRGKGLGCDGERCEGCENSRNN